MKRFRSSDPCAKVQPAPLVHMFFSQNLHITCSACGGQYRAHAYKVKSLCNPFKSSTWNAHSILNLNNMNAHAGQFRALACTIAY